MANAPDNSTTPSLSDDRHADVFIVVPAYNEGPALAEVITALRAEYQQIVVVDDGSTDDTAEVARTHAPFVLRHLINRGQGAALQTGIEFALLRGAKVVVTFDADGQHRVEDVAAIVAPILAGDCDIALGSRFLGTESDIPPVRRVILRLAVLFTHMVSRIKLTDAHNGLRGFSRRAAVRIHITMDRMAHASELIDFVRQCGFAFQEIPVRVRYTKYSMAKGQSSRNAIRIALQYLLGRMMP